MPWESSYSVVVLVPGVKLAFWPILKGPGEKKNPKLNGCNSVEGALESTCYIYELRWPDEKLGKKNLDGGFPSFTDNHHHPTFIRAGSHWHLDLVHAGKHVRGMLIMFWLPIAAGGTRQVKFYFRSGMTWLAKSISKIAENNVIISP